MWQRWMGSFALVVGLGVFFGALSGASAEELEHHFLLGLKAPSMRTRVEATKLAERLRTRLQAARMPNFRVSVDKDRPEVRVKVHTELGRRFVQRILTARGEVLLVPVAPNKEELQELKSSLPPDVMLGFDPFGAEDGYYLLSDKRSKVEQVARGLSLAGFHIFVGAVPSGEVDEGYRTWLVADGASALTQEGLASIAITSGSHPNYYYLTANWSDQVAKNAGAPAKLANKKHWGDAKDLFGSSSKRVGGASGLEIVSREAEGRRLLLLVDGHPVLALRRTSVTTEGQLTIPVLGKSAKDQFTVARQIAAMMSTAPHPCALAVIEAKSEN